MSAGEDHSLARVKSNNEEKVNVEEENQNFSEQVGREEGGVEAQEEKKGQPKKDGDEAEGEPVVKETARGKQDTHVIESEVEKNNRLLLQSVMSLEWLRKGLETGAGDFGDLQNSLQPNNGNLNNKQQASRDYETTNENHHNEEKTNSQSDSAAVGEKPVLQAKRKRTWSKDHDNNNKRKERSRSSDLDERPINSKVPRQSSHQQKSHPHPVDHGTMIPTTVEDWVSRLSAMNNKKKLSHAARTHDDEDHHKIMKDDEKDDYKKMKTSKAPTPAARTKTKTMTAANKLSHTSHTQDGEHHQIMKDDEKGDYKKMKTFKTSASAATTKTMTAAKKPTATAKADDSAATAASKKADESHTTVESLLSALDDDEQISKREYNRLCAAKSRNRRKQQLQLLHEKAEKSASLHRSLMERNDTLRDGVDKLLQFALNMLSTRKQEEQAAAVAVAPPVELAPQYQLQQSQQPSQQPQPQPQPNQAQNFLGGFRQQNTY